MGVVIQLFGEGERPPAADESEFIQQFIDQHWADFVTSVAELAKFASESSVREWIADLREQVGEWPDDG